jgi:hypothetical protein
MQIHFLGPQPGLLQESEAATDTAQAQKPAQAFSALLAGLHTLLTGKDPSASAEPTETQTATDEAEEAGQNPETALLDAAALGAGAAVLLPATTQPDAPAANGSSETESMTAAVPDPAAPIFMDPANQVRTPEGQTALPTTSVENSPATAAIVPMMPEPAGEPQAAEAAEPVLEIQLSSEVEPVTDTPAPSGTEHVKEARNLPSSRPEVPGEATIANYTEAAGQDGNTNSGSSDASGNGEQSGHDSHTPAREMGREPLKMADAATSAEMESSALPDTPVGLEAVVATEELDQSPNTEPDAAAADKPVNHTEAGPRPAATAAWLRSFMARNAQAITMQDGWQVIEMNLEENQGTLTVKAKQDNERVSVAVGLSDPRMGTFIQANAAKIEEVLQAQYEKNVDLSFFSGNAGQNERRQQHVNESGGQTLVNLASGPEGAEPAPRRTRLTGGIREWVG